VVRAAAGLAAPHEAAHGPFLPHARLAQCPELAEADIEEADAYNSASRARIIAGLSGFFTLIQSRDGPDR
jgi:hypothetical protein